VQEIQHTAAISDSDPSHGWPPVMESVSKLTAFVAAGSLIIRWSPFKLRHCLAVKQMFCKQGFEKPLYVRTGLHT
jgi:hypothetical protein